MNSLATWLSRIETRLVPGFVDTAGLERLRDVCGQVPQAVARGLGLETPLGENTRRMDLHVPVPLPGADVQGGARERTARWLQQAAGAGLLPPGVTALLPGSGTDEAQAHALPAEVWFSFDLPPDAKGLAWPSVFFSLGRQEERAEAARTLAAGLDLLEHILTRPLSQGLRDAFFQLQACAAPGSRLLLGAMPGREPAAFKVCLAETTSAQCAQTLQRFSVSMDVSLAQEVLARHVALFDRVDLSLDLLEGPSPLTDRLGLEGYPPETAPSGQRQRWRAVVERLVAEGLCGRDKGRALLAFVGAGVEPGQGLLARAAGDALGTSLLVFRKLDHVKFVVRPRSQVTAKAYGIAVFTPR